MIKSEFYTSILEPIKLGRMKISVRDEDKLNELARRFDSQMFFHDKKQRPRDERTLQEQMFTKTISKLYHHYDYLTTRELGYLKFLLKHYNL